MSKSTFWLTTLFAAASLAAGWTAAGQRPEAETEHPFLGKAELLKQQVEAPGPQGQRPSKKLIMRQQDAPLQFYGVVLFSDGWVGTHDPIGIYRWTVNANGYTRDKVFINDVFSSTYDGYAYSPEGYFIVREESGALFGMKTNYHLLRTSDWKEIGSKLDVPERYYFSHGAYDYTRNRMFMAFDSDSLLANDRLGYMTLPDMNQGWVKHPKIVKVGAASERLSVRAYTMDTDGMVYVIADNGTLYRVNYENGEVTKIGDTKLGKQHYTSMFLDPLTHNLYYFAKTNGASTGINGLYILDKRTAAPTLVFLSNENDRVQGLYMENRPLAVAKAPAAPTDLKWEPTTVGALKGNITFKAPTTLYDGTALAGELDYAVVINTDTVSKGKVAAGGTASVSHEFAKADYYNLRVSLSNAAGASPYKAFDRFIGLDAPVIPSQPTLKVQDNKLHLSWQTPTTGSHDGDIASSDLSYDIVRYPDAVKVATGHKGNTFEEAVPEYNNMAGYHYTVTANGGGVKMHPLNSDTVVLGKINSLPYSTMFKDQKESSAWRVFNCKDPINPDNKTWYWNKTFGYIISYTRYHMNDWVISPSMPMEKGKVYKVELMVSGFDASSKSKERLEVKAGKSQNPAAMTEVVSNPFEIIGVPRRDKNNGEMMHQICYFRPQSTGEYHIGVHGISDPAAYHMYFYGMEVSEGLSENAPSKVTDISFMPDVNKKAAGTLSFKAPTKDFSGKPLTGNVDVEVYRGDSLIQKVTGLAPGQKGSISDSADKAAVVNYRLIASSSNGRGEETLYKIYLGNAIPGVVTNLHAREGEVPGTVVLTWSAPVIDSNNYPFNPGLAKYQIQDSKNTVLADDVADTTVTIKVKEPTDPAAFHYFRVVTKSVAGISTKKVSTPNISVGKALDMPFIEPFSNGKALQAWNQLTYGNVTMAILVDGQASDSDGEKVYSENGDNGYSGFRSDTPGYMGQKWSLKINVTGEHPELSMWLYCYGTNGNTTQVLVNETGDGADWKPIATFDHYTDGPKGWIRKTVDMTPYKGKAIQIGYLHTIVNSTLQLVDHIELNEHKANDLYTGGLLISKEMTAGGTYPGKVIVTNIGDKNAADYTVQLLRNGEVIASQPGIALKAGENHAYSFTETATNGLPRINTYKVNTQYEGDEYQDNNVCNGIKAELTIPDLPRLFNLTGTETSSKGAQLTWTAPDVNLSASDTTETVDNFTAFSIGNSNSAVEGDNMGGWVSIDRDGKKPLPVVVSNKTYTFPNSDRAFGFIVWSWQETGITSIAWKGHGNSARCFMSMGVDGAKDDWLITPVLTGLPTDLSLWARNNKGSAGTDYMDIYICKTNSVNPEDYELYSDSIALPTAWGQLTFEVPYGTKRVAIRAHSSNGSNTLIDDFVYNVASNRWAGMSPAGYNIYRNGIKINTSAITGTTYTDATPDRNINNIYTVTTMFGNKESGASNAWTLERHQGVNTIGAGNGDVAVTVQNRVIMIDGLTSGTAMVASVDGRQTVVRCAMPHIEVRVNAPGVYVVKAGGKSLKVLVK